MRDLEEHAQHVSGRDVSTGRARIGDIHLHYGLCGDADGDPVLLWHGFLETSACWRGVMELLADAGLAVLAPDMRGYGDSDKPEGTDGYDGRSLADDFRGLVAELGFGGGRPLTLVGHDMGAPPALLWAADHPDEVKGLVYAEAPAMLQDVLQPILTYAPDTMAEGSMWWWILPLAPGVPDRLVVGHEEAFLTWFYEGAVAHPGAIEPAEIAEVLRTFAGHEGVLGAMGVYRAAFTTIAQTTPLTEHPVEVPIVAVGGDQGLGAGVGEQLGRLGLQVERVVLADCGHFIAQEQPGELARRIIALARGQAGGSPGTGRPLEQRQT